VWDERFLRRLSELTPTLFAVWWMWPLGLAISVQLQGWGYLPSRSQRAHAIIIAGFESGKIPENPWSGFHWPARPDVAAALHSQEALPTGWAIDLPWRLPIHIDTFYSRLPMMRKTAKPVRCREGGLCLRRATKPPWLN